MDTDTLKKVEKLANLSISPQKQEKITKNLLDILSYIDTISNAEVSDLQETFNASGKKNITAKDVPVNVDHLTVEEVLQNASKKYKTYFQINKVIDN